MAEIKQIKVEDLREYEDNPRRNEKAVQPVANSLKKFGFVNPIIVNKDLVILAGHTRLKAAKANGMKKVPVVVVDDMTEDQEKAFRLADNRVAEFSRWDDEKLKQEIAALVVDDWSDFGVSDRELSKYEPDDGVQTCPKCGCRFEE